MARPLAPLFLLFYSIMDKNHNGGSARTVFHRALNITTTAALSFIDPSSSSRDNIITKDIARPARGAADSPSPWRSILGTYGRDILSLAQDPF